MMSRQVEWLDNLSNGGWLNGLLTFVAGASLIGAFAPFSHWWLIFPGLTWYLLPLQGLNNRQTLYRGLWFNSGFFAAGISWVHISIHRFGEAPLPLSIPLTIVLVLVLSLFASLTVILLNRFFSHLSSRLYFLVALPFIWLLMEWVSSWFLTGFPWFNLGYSQLDGYLSAVAPLMGSAGISFLVILLSGAVILIIRQGKPAIKISASIVSFILILVAFVQPIKWVEKTQNQLSFSLIQPSIAQDMKWLPEQRRQTLEYFHETTMSLDSQLIIWPEGAIPALARHVSKYLTMIDQQTKRKSQALMTGIAVQEGEQYFNATIMLGEGEGRYYKQHLLPFGEYVPFESSLRGLIQLFDLPMSSFSAGSSGQPLLKTGDWNIAMALCYEIIFQDVVADQLTGADILITLSNDAWFGDSIGVYQHLAIARMRALENGIPVIRATNDGISALIDHRGKVLDRMEKLERGVMSGIVTKASGLTPYRQLGPGWSYFLLLLIPALILIYNRKK